MESFPPISQSGAGEVGRGVNCLDAALKRVKKKKIDDTL